MRLTSTSIADAVATAAVKTIEAVLVATSTSDMAASEVALAAQMQTAIAERLTAQPTATTDLAATMTAQAMSVATAVAATLSAPPTLTFLPTPSQTPTSSPTRPPLIATVNTAALNLRTGPGTAYSVVQSYTQGIVVTVLGKDSSEQWLKVETPDGEVGWMAMGYLRLSADLVNITVVEIPPTPTPTLNR